MEASLTVREIRVLKKHHGFEEEKSSLEEIAKQENITRERVRQIEAQAFRKLRKPKTLYRLQGYGSIVPEKPKVDIKKIENAPKTDVGKPTREVSAVASAEKAKPIKDDVAEVQSIPYYRYQPEGTRKKPAKERVSSGPQLRKEDLYRSAWKERTFWYYTKAVSQGEITSLESKDFPRSIEMGKPWHEIFNKLRHNALNESLFNATLGSSVKGKNEIFNLFDVNWHTDLIDSERYLEMLEEIIRSNNLNYYSGDIQGPTRIMVLRIGGFELGRHLPNEEAGIKPRQVYRFLADRRRPIFTAKSHHDWNFLLLRAKDTLTLDPNDVYSNQEVFETAWRKVRGVDNTLWGINQIMSKTDRFVLYYGKPNSVLWRAD